MRSLFRQAPDKMCPCFHGGEDSGSGRLGGFATIAPGCGGYPTVRQGGTDGTTYCWIRNMGELRRANSAVLCPPCHQPQLAVSALQNSHSCEWRVQFALDYSILSRWPPRTGGFRTPAAIARTARRKS